MNKVLTLLIGLFFVGCATQNPTTNLELTKGEWQMILLNNESIASAKPVTFEFKVNQISGFTGCNRLIGNYSLQGENLSFTNLGSSRKMCDPQTMQIESEVLKVLNATKSVKTKNGQLMLTDAKGNSLAVLQRMDDNKIVNKYWKLTELDGKKVSMVDNQEKEQFFVLKSDGTMNGFAGCNNFNGEYELIDGNRIKFSENIAISMRMCPEIDKTEREFMRVFKQANNYTIHKDELFLNIGKRAPLAKFEAVYF